MEGSRRLTKYVLSGRGWILPKRVRYVEDRRYCFRGVIATQSLCPMKSRSNPEGRKLGAAVR